MESIITVELPDDSNIEAYNKLKMFEFNLPNSFFNKYTVDMRYLIFKSPKSKEGCKVTERQAKQLNKIVFSKPTPPLRTYCMLKRLILLKK